MEDSITGPNSFSSLCVHPLPDHFTVFLDKEEESLIPGLTLCLALADRMRRKRWCGSLSLGLKSLVYPAWPSATIMRTCPGQPARGCKMWSRDKSSVTQWPQLTPTYASNPDKGHLAGRPQARVKNAYVYVAELLQQYLNDTEWLKEKKNVQQTKKPST